MVPKKLHQLISTSWNLAFLLEIIFWRTTTTNFKMPFQCRFWFLVCKMNVIIWPFWPFPTPKANKSNLAMMLLKISQELTPILLDLIHGELKSHSKILHPAFDFKWVKILIFCDSILRWSEFLSQSWINLRSSVFSDQKVGHWLTSVSNFWVFWWLSNFSRIRQ